MEFDWCNSVLINDEKFELFNNSILVLQSVNTQPYKQKSVLHDTNQTSSIQHNNKELTSENPFKKQLLTSDLPQGLSSNLPQGLSYDIPIILNVCDCHLLEPIKTTKDIIIYLNYLEQLSNSMRNTVRELGSKFQFDETIKNLKWIYNTCDTFKNMFISNKINDYPDKQNSKLFKTSSYNFCNLKESCQIHSNKSKKCNRHHFVFNYIMVDIQNLIHSLTMLDKDTVNFIFNDCSIKYVGNEIIRYNTSNEDKNDSYNYINKNTICKCFDVISYVIKKMSGEIKYFIASKEDSCYVKLL